ncbi:MAG: GTPase Era [Vulcanimicrobiota bacterium]
MYRSGFVALVGKPNVGKSTLINRLVGTKVAITSSKPQTTRHRVLGVMHGQEYQIVLVDTPGLMQPRHALGRKMEKWALEESREADLVLFLVELTHAPTAEDRFAAEHLAPLGDRVWLVMNKLDRCKDEQVAEQYQALGGYPRSFQVSALEGQGLEQLTQALCEVLPEGDPFFPPDQVTDQNRALLASEVIREKVLHLTRQEIPHAVAVVVDELRPADKPDMLYLSAYLYVERPNQKRILIGKNGQLLKSIGAEARLELEQLWGQRVFLELWVKVKEGWRDREDWLRSLGYE